MGGGAQKVPFETLVDGAYATATLEVEVVGPVAMEYRQAKPIKLAEGVDGRWEESDGTRWFRYSFPTFQEGDQIVFSWDGGSISYTCKQEKYWSFDTYSEWYDFAWDPNDQCRPRLGMYSNKSAVEMWEYTYPQYPCFWDSFALTDPQSAASPWDAPGHYGISIRFLGEEPLEATIGVEVVAKPVSLEFQPARPIVFTEGVGTRWVSDLRAIGDAWQEVEWKEYDLTFSEGDRFVVRMPDGTSEEYTWAGDAFTGQVTVGKVGTATVTLTAAETEYYRKASTTVTVNVIGSLANAAIGPIAKMVYTGKEQKPSPVVTFGGKALVAGADYTVSYGDNVNAGIATVTVTGIGGFTEKATATFEIAKAPQSIKAGNCSASFKGKKKALAKNRAVDLKKKAKVSAKTAVKFKKANKAGGKKIAVDAKTGKVTLKKGLKKGSYKVKVKLTAAASANYKAAKAKTITLTVRVK